MANLTQGERMVKIEEKLEVNSLEHAEIKADIKEIKNMLAATLEKKLDKSDFLDMRNKQWAVIMAVITSFIGLIIYEIQRPR